MITILKETYPIDQPGNFHPGLIFFSGLMLQGWSKLHRKWRHQLLTFRKTWEIIRDILGKCRNKTWYMKVVMGNFTLFLGHYWDMNRTWMGILLGYCDYVLTWMRGGSPSFPHGKSTAWGICFGFLSLSGWWFLEKHPKLEIVVVCGDFRIFVCGDFIVLQIQKLVELTRSQRLMGPLFPCPMFETQCSASSQRAPL